MPIAPLMMRDQTAHEVDIGILGVIHNYALRHAIHGIPGSLGGGLSDCGIFVPSSSGLG